jgi:hypothetical protein
MSYNPFLPDGGETIMFRGPSHDNGGMPVSYGQNGVEVEGGEPAVKLQDGGSPDGNLVVYGNMVIPKYGVAELGDKNAKGKKFKHYVADLSKIEAKQGKLIEKTTTLINNADANDQFDKLSLNTGQANLIGTTMKLKEIAEKKKTAAAVQNAILDTATEMGVESDALAKGKIKYAKANDPYAKFGAKMETAQTGAIIGGMQLSPIAEALPGSYLSNLDKEIALARFLQNEKNTTRLANVDVKFEPEYNTLAPSKIKNLPVNIPAAISTQIKPGKYVSSTQKDKEKEPKGKSNFPWEDVMTGVNSMLPFLRPSNQIPLDPSQLSGELYAMSQNQEEPVFAQSYQPLLTQTSNISLQDQLNEITAQSRAAERMAQGNPAALAMIASQAAEAKNKVLGEQFRMNQGEAQRVAETNRQTMNEAQKTNLGLYDQQQQRASQAKSNTKLQNIAALNSINDKIAKQKLENRQIALTENLYNYRFTPNGVAYNMNPLAQFNLAGGGAGKGMSGDLETGKDFSYNKAGKIIGIHSIGKDDSKKNGGIVKAIKNL